MENLIKFETAPRPVISGRTKFPYEEVLKSLSVLDSTSSIVFPEKECTYNNNIKYLSEYAKKLGEGTLKHCKKNKKIYLWLQK